MGITVKNGQLTKEQLDCLWSIFNYCENCFEYDENVDPNILSEMKQNFPKIVLGFWIKPNDGMEKVDQSPDRKQPFLENAKLIQNPSELDDPRDQATMAYKIAVLIGNYDLAESLLDNEAFKLGNFRNPCLQVTAALASNKLLEVFLSKFPSSDKIPKQDTAQYIKPAIEAALKYGSNDNAKAIMDLVGKEAVGPTLADNVSIAR